MKNWFNADVFIIDAIEGGEIEIPINFGGDEVIIEGEIGLVLPKEKFVFTWIERNQNGDAWFNNTSISIELEQKSDCGTKCTFTHDGFKYLPEDEREGIYKRYLEFWEHSDILKRLKSLIGVKT
jgi:hypothetical protein